MLKWLLPKEIDFFAYFDRHSEVLSQISESLKSLVLDKHLTGASIKDLEHEADKITYDCVQKLHQSFITPFQREDIHKLISSLDDIADDIDEVAERLFIYKINQMPKGFIKQTEILVKATHLLRKILLQFHELKMNKEIQTLFQEMIKLEKEGDEIHKEALQKIFDGSHDAVEIIKWKEIQDKIEEAIDGCEKVANLVEGIILESN